MKVSYLKLALKGWSLADIKELEEMEKNAKSPEGTESEESEESEESKGYEESEESKGYEESEESEEGTEDIDYKALYEAEKEKVKKLQNDNVNKNVDNNEPKSSEEILDGIVSKFM